MGRTPNRPQPRRVRAPVPERSSPMRTRPMRRTRAPRSRRRRTQVSDRAEGPASSRQTRTQRMRRAKAPHARRRRTPASVRPFPSRNRARSNETQKAGPAWAQPLFLCRTYLTGDAQAFEQWRADQHVGGRDVGRQRHVADIANSEQRLDVRVVRVLIQWIDEEDDRIDFAFDHAAGDLHIPTMWTRSDALDLEANLISQQVSGGPGGDQLVFAQACAVEGRKRNQVRLLAIVGNDREARTVAVSGQFHAG